MKQKSPTVYDTAAPLSMAKVVVFPTQSGYLGSSRLVSVLFSCLWGVLETSAVASLAAGSSRATEGVNVV